MKHEMVLVWLWWWSSGVGVKLDHHDDGDTEPGKEFLLL